MGVKISGLASLSKKLNKISDLSKPINKSLNRSTQSLKTVASRAVRKEVTLGESYTNSLINRRIKPATPQKQTGEIAIYLTKKGVLFDRFKFTVNRKGKVKLNLSKGGGALNIDNAFMFQLKNGRKTPVFRKKHEKGKYAFAMYGPSPSQIINTKSDEIKKEATEKFEKELDRQIDMHLKGIKLK